MSAAPSSQHANRLAGEKSPYLRQHAANPVDWYPWGSEAFAKARAEDKPILLSIGYSTCHWCHVMAHESFEDAEIAALMNRWFVCIKVDREEHPDVDQIYMAAVMRMRGQGGWPLTVFLTPDGKPFFGGTYFPPQGRWGMPGMHELLPSVAEAWARRRSELIASAEQLTQALDERMEAVAAQGPSPQWFERAFDQACGEFDAANGGFGAAPKFPRPHELSFLLRYAARSGSAKAREMAETTLDHITRGGIRDHLGGGFHRYSTDAGWLVPHFEKMLYDQALLATAYLESFRLTRNETHAAVAREIFSYVLGDLRDAGGAFCSAEDADSDGEEGKFYVWTQKQILDVLGAEEGAFFSRAYGVTGEGNFEHGKNILHLPQPLGAAADARLSAARAKLLAERAMRIRPQRDDKILTSWNGLMIAALALGSTTLAEARYADAARQAAQFVLSRLVKDGKLLRRFCGGEALHAGSLEDYACFSWGLLALYETDFDPAWLAQAKAIADAMIRRFWDDASGGFFMRDKNEEPLIVRSKEFYDGATPSGNSVAVSVLVRLGRLTADGRYENLAEQSLKAFGPVIARMPFGFPWMLGASDVLLGPGQEIVIAGDAADAVVRAMTEAFHRRFLPRAVILLHPSGGPWRGAVESLAPRLKTQDTVNGRTAAYVCSNHVCALPVTSLDAFSEALNRAARPLPAVAGSGSCP